MSTQQGFARLKYLEIADALEVEIRSGRYRVGQQLPSERDLCQNFSVANHTLRKALELLHQRGLILRQQGRGTFVVDPSLRAVALESTPSTLPAIRLIGLGPSDPIFQDPTSWEIRFRRYQGVVEAGFKFGLFTQSINVIEHREEPGWLYEHLLDSAGIVMDCGTPYPIADEAVIRLREASIPVVTINRQENEICSDVRVDIRQGARLAAGHLLGLGHRRVGMILGRVENVFMRRRLEGYRDALAAHDVPYAPGLVAEYLGSPESAHEPLERLLSLAQRPTALFCSNDLLALAAMHELRARGLRVPEDMAIVGYDDLQRAAGATPALTTVHNPLYECGFEAVRLLHEQMQSKDRTIHVQMLPVSLVVRKSCGSHLTR